MTQQLKKTLKIFFCYAYDIYKDEEILGELERHLSFLELGDQTVSWYIRTVSTREKIREIDTKLNTADIILLLLTSEFINSDYCRSDQMIRALKRHQMGEVRIIPIVFYPVDWKDTPFGILQPLPTNGEPIVSWSNREKALLNVTEGIRQAIEELINSDLEKPHSAERNSDLAELPSTSDIISIGKKQKAQEAKQEVRQVTVDQILQKDHMYYFVYNYRFPTLDFKFQNVGTATAFLWQFAINVLCAEIDPTPELDFKLRVENGALEIVAINNGWGAAHDCHIYIEEPTLERLFSEANRTYIGTVPEGGELVILSLIKALTNPEQFESITNEFIDLTHLDISFPRNAFQGINLTPLLVKWTYKDEKGTNHKGEEKLLGFDRNGDFILTQDGFVKTYNPRSGGGAPSDITYSAIIDPSIGPHERLYRISRQIPPGGIERFHIMIASPMSCNLIVQFKLYVDTDQVITSEIFDLDIKNPRNSQWHYGYRDGDELKRDIGEKQKLLNSTYTNNENNELRLSVLRYLEQLASNYPFILGQHSPDDLFGKGNKKRKWFFD